MALYLGQQQITALSQDTASKSWVQNQGYLTEVPSTYADKTYVDTAIESHDSSVNTALQTLSGDTVHNSSVWSNDFFVEMNQAGTDIQIKEGARGKLPDTSANALSVGYTLANLVYPRLTNLENNKQDALVSGTNIKTINNQSILGEGNLTIDLTLYRVVQSLPASGIDPNKIYLMLNPDGSTNNAYDEYMYVDDGWEKIGQMGNNIDLTGYLTIADASQNFATKASLADYVQTANLDSAVSGLNYVKSSTLNDYLLSSTASQTYLTIADASTTYVKDASLDSKVTALGYAKTTAIPTAYSDLTNDKGYKAIVLCTEAEYAAMVSAGTVDADTVYLTH